MRMLEYGDPTAIRTRDLRFRKPFPGWFSAPVPTFSRSKPGRNGGNVGNIPQDGNPIFRPRAAVFQFPIRSRYHLRMSDKTKFYADQALIAQRMREQFAREAAKGDTRPRCQCGLTWNDVPLMWAMPVGRHEKAKFCCPACLPVEMLGLVAGDVGRLKDGE